MAHPDTDNSFYDIRDTQAGYSSSRVEVHNHNGDGVVLACHQSTKKPLGKRYHTQFIEIFLTREQANNLIKALEAEAV